jgi:nicotinate-nucleotide pyrophosphorylase (carboxylating)
MPNNKFLELLQATIKIAIIEDILPIEDNIKYINNLQDLELSKIISQRIMLPNNPNNENNIATAKIFTRQQMIFCGEDIVTTALQLILPESDYQFTLHVKDGDQLNINDIICHITAPAEVLLMLERTILNFIQSLSATATTTRQYIDAIAGFLSIDNTPVKVLDTRKTIPHLRVLQKYAVTVGGGHNQRFGLYDAILIKENNLKNFANIKDAVQFYRTQATRLKPDNIWQDQYQLQLEVENISQFQEALELQIPQIMLDNMSIEQINNCIDMLKYHNKTSSNKIELEISGDINLANIRSYAQTGVHRISTGALTKNINAVNLSMIIE